MGTLKEKLIHRHVLLFNLLSASLIPLLNLEYKSDDIHGIYIYGCSGCLIIFSLIITVVCLIKLKQSRYEIKEVNETYRKHRVIWSGNITAGNRIIFHITFLVVVLVTYGYPQCSDQSALLKIQLVSAWLSLWMAYSTWRYVVGLVNNALNSKKKSKGKKSKIPLKGNGARKTLKSDTLWNREGEEGKTAVTEYDILLNENDVDDEPNVETPKVQRQNDDDDDAKKDRSSNILLDKDEYIWKYENSNIHHV